MHTACIHTPHKQINKCKIDSRVQYISAEGVEVWIYTHSNISRVKVVYVSFLSSV